MPTYEYACQGCDHSFELYQTMGSEPIRKCPSCKRMRLKRLIGTGAGLIFKGTGFYQTDYKQTTAPAGESGSSGSEGAATTESKPVTEKKPESRTAPSAESSA